MDKIIINVLEKATITLTCIKCRNSREIPVTAFSSKDNRYRIKCKCGNNYIITLERRKFNRKVTDLRGTYVADKFAREEIVDIINLSTTGLCLVRRDNRNLEQGQIINLNFKLENVERDEIKCKATIIQVKDEKVGVEFLDLSPGIKTILGFYLFNYVDRDSRVKEINFPILPAS